MLSIALLGSLARATPRALAWLLAGTLVFVLVVLGFSTSAQAEEAAPGLDPSLLDSVRSLALGNAVAAGPHRVEVAIGQLDPRLHLAPCRRIEPYVPLGVRLWGKARIGLRCKEGPTLWNVSLPLPVKVYGRAVVVPGGAAAGSVIAASDLAEAEVDLAEEFSPAIIDPKVAEGRVLAQVARPGPVRGAAQGAPVFRRRRDREARRFRQGLCPRSRRPGTQQRRRRSAGARAHRKRPRADGHPVGRAGRRGGTVRQPLASLGSPRKSPKVAPCDADSPSMLMGAHAFGADGEHHEDR